MFSGVVFNGSMYVCIFIHVYIGWFVLDMVQNTLNECKKLYGYEEKVWQGKKFTHFGPRSVFFKTH